MFKECLFFLKRVLDSELLFAEKKHLPVWQMAYKTF